MGDIQAMALTVNEAVAVTKLSRTELYRAFHRGDLIAKKHGRRTLILREDLVRFMSSLPNALAA